MELLDRLEMYGDNCSKEIAFINCHSNEKLTYGNLTEISNRLAAYLSTTYKDKKPIVVYGHKSPLMIPTFLGCVKAGHPYCPVDTSMPDERLRDIIDVSRAELLIKVEETDVECQHYLTPKEIMNLPAPKSPENSILISGEDVFYIIFTSGSTGKPKGVQITANCLDNYLNWMESIAKREGFDLAPIILNQAPFSFDLSVMDVYTSLYLGGTIFSLDRVVQEDMEVMYEKMQNSGVTVWVSTPSFMNMCLINTAFNQEMLPRINSFLFCGEVLTNKTAKELHKRFPSAQIINTYGPTESTVAVTEVVVSEEMMSAETVLSIGYPKPGTEIFIMDDKYSYPGLPEGEKGEIIIAGNTVAKGYLNCSDLTEEKFFTIKTPDGELRAYKTGDEGWLKAGRLYYSGRMDFQLKINGFRIELGDIENNIIKLDNIKACVVLPIEKNGTNKGLAAFVSLEKRIDDEFEYSQIIRKHLMNMIPHYMVPKKYIFVDDMPRTNNGKVDRRVLKEMLRKEIHHGRKGDDFNF